MSVIIMVIERNGQEFELTSTELLKAFREQEINFHIEDAKWCWEEMYKTKFPYGDDVARHIVSVAENYLEDCDAYFECYWESYKHAINQIKTED